MKLLTILHRGKRINETLCKQVGQTSWNVQNFRTTLLYFLGWHTQWSSVVTPGLLSEIIPVRLGIWVAKIQTSVYPILATCKANSCYCAITLSPITRLLSNTEPGKIQSLDKTITIQNVKYQSKVSLRTNG